jgi:hypothetical protein
MSGSAMWNQRRRSDVFLHRPKLTRRQAVVYASDAASAIAASDRITAIIRGAAPLKARLLAVSDALAGLMRGVN